MPISDEQALVLIYMVGLLLLALFDNGDPPSRA